MRALPVLTVPVPPGRRALSTEPFCRQGSVLHMAQGHPTASSTPTPLLVLGDMGCLVSPQLSELGQFCPEAQGGGGGGTRGASRFTGGPAHTPVPFPQLPQHVLLGMPMTHPLCDKSVPTPARSFTRAERCHGRSWAQGRLKSPVAHAKEVPAPSPGEPGQGWDSGHPAAGPAPEDLLA